MIKPGDKMKKQDFRLLAISGILTTLFVGTAMASEEGMAMEVMSGNAIITNAWMHYAEWFVILTAYPAVIMMLFIALSLHVARPMVVRYLNRMTLRLGADLLWEGWIIGRDVLILSAVGFLGVLILPRLQNEWFTGVLVPAFILGIITLIYKLSTDTDANKTKYMIATGLTALTLVAATLPYGISSLWHDKGHEKFEKDFLTPLSAYDMQQKVMGTQQQGMMENVPNIIKNIEDATNRSIEAMEMGDSSKAVTESQEADTLHEKLEVRLMAWNSVKHDQLEDAFKDLINAAKKSDVVGMKTAREKIQKILEEFETTL